MQQSEQATVTREVDVDADVETVWESVSTKEGRERWIEDDPDRVLIVDEEQAPERISWWWWNSQEPARHVEVRVVEIATGARVIVTETAPAFLPLARMVACFTPALAVA